MRAAAKAAIAAAAALNLCLLVAGSTGPAQAAPTAAASIARPPITKWAIPFGAKRKAEMAAYSERHYGEDEWRLRDPRVIVEHISVTGSAAAVYNTFAPDTPDVELGELPNVCSHFVIGSSGRIFQLVNLRTRCRHTVGLNWTAIGIEHVGSSDRQVLDNASQLNASLHLVAWLRCRYQIQADNVIGHNESLQSPYHHENVEALRTQTHGDFGHADMQIYRARLRTLPSC
jgi:beta-N-acetylhexosaminidase